MLLTRTINSMNQKQRNAAGKILRRCTICKKFHASYLVEIPEFGKCYLCYSCWKSRQQAELSQTETKEIAPEDEVGSSS